MIRIDSGADLETRYAELLNRVLARARGAFSEVAALADKILHARLLGADHSQVQDEMRALLNDIREAVIVADRAIAVLPAEQDRPKLLNLRNRLANAGAFLDHVQDDPFEQRAND